MFRFLVGAVLGAFGMLYLVAALLPASRETETTASFPSVWGTDSYDGRRWTWTSNTPAT
jgi:hypothetical protein